MTAQYIASSTLYIIWQITHVRRTILFIYLDIYTFLIILPSVFYRLIPCKYCNKTNPFLINFETCKIRFTYGTNFYVKLKDTFFIPTVILE